jgi:hypothetical protein
MTTSPQVPNKIRRNRTAVPIDWRNRPGHTIDTVCALLCLGESAVYAKLATGELERRKIGPKRTIVTTASILRVLGEEKSS